VQKSGLVCCRCFLSFLGFRSHFWAWACNWLHFCPNVHMRAPMFSAAFEFFPEWQSSTPRTWRWCTQRTKSYRLLCLAVMLVFRLKSPDMLHVTCFLGLPEPFEASERSIMIISHGVLRRFKTLAAVLNSWAPWWQNCSGSVLLSFSGPAFLSSILDCRVVSLKIRVAYSTGPEGCELPGGSWRRKTFGEGCMLTYITSSGLGWGWCLIAAYIVLSLWSPSGILLAFSLPSFKSIEKEKLKRNAALFCFWILVSVWLQLQTLSPHTMKLRRRREDAGKKWKCA